MTFSKIAGLALIAACTFSSSAFASSINTFNFGDTSTSDSLEALQGTTATNSISNIANILGGFQTVSATRTTGTGNVTARVNNNNTGFFSLDIDDNFTGGSVSVFLDNSGAGLGGLDLTDLGNIGATDDQLDVNIVGLVGLINVSITLIDTGSFSSTVTNTAVFQTGIQSFALADFIGIDVTSIDSIQLTLTSLQNGSDADLEFLGTSDATPDVPQTSVPAPASLALLALGLVAMRRKAARS